MFALLMRRDLPEDSPALILICRRYVLCGIVKSIELVLAKGNSSLLAALFARHDKTQQIASNTSSIISCDLQSHKTGSNLRNLRPADRARSGQFCGPANRVRPGLNNLGQHGQPRGQASMGARGGNFSACNRVRLGSCKCEDYDGGPKYYLVCVAGLRSRTIGHDVKSMSLACDRVRPGTTFRLGSSLEWQYPGG